MVSFFGLIYYLKIKRKRKMKKGTELNTYGFVSDVFRFNFKAFSHDIRHQVLINRSLFFSLEFFVSLRSPPRGLRFHHPGVSKPLLLYLRSLDLGSLNILFLSVVLDSYPLM